MYILAESGKIETIRPKTEKEFLRKMARQRKECKKCNKQREMIEELKQINEEYPEYVPCDNCLPWQQIDDVLTPDEDVERTISWQQSTRSDDSGFRVIELVPGNHFLVKQEGVSLLPIIFQKIEALVEKIYNSEAKQARFEFLGKIIPAFKQRSAVAKEKINRCFVEETILPGQILVHEGITSDEFAYLIFEGEFKLTCKKNTLTTEIESGQIKKNWDKVTIEGWMFIPKSIQTFQLGYLKAGEWVAKEYIFDEDQVMDYTATATTKSRVLRILYSDFKTKLPKDFVDMSQDHSQ